MALVEDSGNGEYLCKFAALCGDSDVLNVVDDSSNTMISVVSITPFLFNYYCYYYYCLFTFLLYLHSNNIDSTV